ncbi:PX domain containing protein [Leishmania donovani]|uniref:PX domain family protein n=2 Tax=Leishmania donovani TaxID=5661 RepID=A0A504Y5F1_LEIDO|nr:PX domain family protein [Leishmania donovani]CAJ1987286.1 PX domain containing protein [Leishmania donovani]
MLSNNASPFEEEYQRTAAPAPRPPATGSSSASVGDVKVPLPQAQSPPLPPQPPQPTAAYTSTGCDVTSSESIFSAPPAPLSAPPATESEPSIAPHTHTHGRVVLARFRIDAAFKGNEMMRPITYFPITTEILAENDASFTVPDVPANAPHLAGIDIGVRRNDWSRGNSASVDRRYSEVVDLRELLTYQFPTLIMSPLPRKSSVSDIETYFSASDAFAAQRHNLQFFLNEIACMPEVIFFSEWVAPFFLDPRDTFETGTLLRMRAALRDLRLATHPFRECSKRHRSFTEYTANKIAAKSSSLVRSVAGFFFSSKNDDSATDGRGGDGHPNGGGSVPVPTSSSSFTYDWTYLPPSAKSDACAWVRVCEQLARRQQALKASARSFEKYLAALTHMKDAQLKVAQSFENYEHTLRSSPALDALGGEYHLAVSMIDAVTQKEREYIERKYLNMCLRLGFEANLIDAVLDAVDVVLGQYQFLSSAQLMNTRDRTHEEALLYTQAVSRALLADYRDRYKFFYEKRMRNLVREQVVRPAIECAAAVQQVMKGSALLRVVQDAFFTEVNPTASSPAATAA